MPQSSATVVFCGDATAAVCNVHGTPIQAREYSTMTRAGPNDLRKPVTMIPSYDLQGADHFIMPALSGTDDAAFHHASDAGVQEQLSSICQV
jgi:hypothetical protein